MCAKCWRCFRPEKSCYCKYIIPVDSGIKFVFLMHPKEAYKQKTGTGRLASLTLVDSEIITGIDFTADSRVNELLADSRYMPFLLYPGEDACAAADPQLGAALEKTGRRLLVFVVDATWFFAKKMLRLSANVRQLQKLSFKNGYRSRFIFKHQPQPECLSTIESCYYLIQELQSSGCAVRGCNPEPLMNVFEKMVQFQLDSQKQRELSGEPDRYWNSKPRSKKSRGRAVTADTLS